MPFLRSPSLRVLALAILGVGCVSSDFVESTAAGGSDVVGPGPVVGSGAQGVGASDGGSSIGGGDYGTGGTIVGGTGGAGPSCGDMHCAANESCMTCPEDCGTCAMCGDGTCSAADGEDCDNCFEDCGVCACASDPFETNNSSPLATIVNKGIDYCALSVCAGDVDWLRFTHAGTSTLTLTFVEAEGDLDVEVYSVTTVDYVDGAYASGDDETLTLSGVPAGAYWARVIGKGGAENPDYCFRVD